MRYRASLFSLLLLPVAPTACGGSSATPDAPTRGVASDDATAIVAKVAERYASAKTYADEGTFRTVYRETDGREKHHVTGRFKTRWRAPDRLTFVLNEDAADFHHGQNVAVSFGTDGKPFDARAVAESLAKMHGTSNGVSGGAPLWLVEGFHPTRQYQLKGRAPCGDSECHVLETVIDATDRTTLVVDTKTFAVRRVMRRTMVTPQRVDEETLAALPPTERDRVRLRQVDPFITEDDIAISPNFDSEIDPSSFEVDPTASSSRDRSGR